MAHLPLSKVIMGTWQAGKEYWPGIDDAQIKEAISAAFHSGITSFDTAEEYGNGLSEQTLGAVLKPHRQQVQLLSKVFSNHLRAEQVREACHRSLQNLQTDYLDLYQIHWPAGSWDSDVVPIGETMEALLKLRDEGKILHIGVSNFTLEELQAANAHGDVGYIQPSYNLFWRAFDKHLRPYCETHGIHILAYSALAQGLLAGKFSTPPTFGEDDNRRANRLFKAPHLDRALLAINQLRPIAEAKGLTLAQLTLSWCAAQPNTYPIAGARNATQITDSARVTEIQLDAETLAEVDRIGRQVSDPFMDTPLLWDWEP